MKKILISDFDKTFYTENYIKNIELVNQFVEAGNQFIIATGRPYYFLKPDIEKYHIKYEYLICSDGAIIFDKNGNIIYSKRIRKETIEKIIFELEGCPYVDDWYINEPFQFSKESNNVTNGILGVPGDKDKIKSLIDKINRENNDIKAYLSHKWINVIPSDISKKEAIEYLVELNNWDKNQIITAGDNLNDIEMNKHFMSYAVSDSEEELIKVSNFSVKDFEEIIKKETRN